VGDWSTRDFVALFCPAGDSVGYVYFVSLHWRAIIGAGIMGRVVLLGCISYAHCVSLRRLCIVLERNARTKFVF
jgi:hypothetical protein